MKNHVQTGRMMTIIAAATLTSGQVVAVGQLIGIASKDAAIGEEVELAMDGVYEVPKVSGAVIAQGESLTWDASAAAFDDNLATPAAGDIQGPPAVAWKAAGNGVLTMLARITGVPGTKT
jgi:predicted RecA/RadA family phage recombinase